MKRIDKVNIVQQKWDYLIILDACRYDYFEQVYQDYVHGELTKKVSIGSSTKQWRDKSFPGYYDDVVYISANPHFSINEPVYGFTAGDHFHKVYEVWKTDWDKDKGTVLPEVLTKAAIDIIKNTKGKRFIIHYLQPHEPYLLAQVNSHGYNKGDINSNRTLMGLEKKIGQMCIRRVLLKKLLGMFRNNRIFTNRLEWFFRQLLCMAPKTAMDDVRRKYGKKVLRQAYKANLIYALEQIAVLLKYLSGRIIITSDHGELLGEKRNFGHPPDSSDPILTEVPWLTIEKSVDIDVAEDESGKQLPAKGENQTEKNENEATKEEISNKLKALGYFD